MGSLCRVRGRGPWRSCKHVKTREDRLECCCEAATCTASWGAVDELLLREGPQSSSGSRTHRFDDGNRGKVNAGSALTLVLDTSHHVRRPPVPPKTSKRYVRPLCRKTVTALVAEVDVQFGDDCVVDWRKFLYEIHLGVDTSLFGQT